MRRSGTIATLAIGALLALPCQAANLLSNPMAGSWEGTITLDKSSHSFDDATEARIRFEVQGSVVHVFAYEKGKLVEVQPGRFKIVQEGPNALIFANVSGDVWPHREFAETISYAITTQ